MRNIADVTKAVANGDLSKKITVDVRRNFGSGNTINTMVDQLNGFAGEVSRVAAKSSTELGGQAAVPGVASTWKDLTDNVNSVIPLQMMLTLRTASRQPLPTVTFEKGHG